MTRCNNIPSNGYSRDEMIQRMREGKDIDAASDGSRLDNGRTSAGWLI